MVKGKTKSDEKRTGNLLLTIFLIGIVLVTGGLLATIQINSSFFA